MQTPPGLTRPWLQCSAGNSLRAARELHQGCGDLGPGFVVLTGNIPFVEGVQARLVAPQKASSIQGVEGPGSKRDSAPPACPPAAAQSLGGPRDRIQALRTGCCPRELGRPLTPPCGSPCSGWAGPGKAPSRHRPCWVACPATCFYLFPPSGLLWVPYRLSLLSSYMRLLGAASSRPFWVLLAVVTFSSVLLFEPHLVPQLGMTPVAAQWGRGHI